MLTQINWSWHFSTPFSLQIICLDLQKIKNYLGEIYGVSGFTIRPILLRPKSRGFLTLYSKDPRDAPLVDIGYLQHPDDVATLVNGEPKRRDGVRGGHTRCRGGGAGVKWMLGEDEEGIFFKYTYYWD